MHIPVLQKEVLEYLAPEPGQNFIDCTIGQGGHTISILDKIAPNGKALGIDRTPEIIKSLKSKVQSLKLDQRLILVCENFVNLREIVKKYNFKKVHPVRDQRALEKTQRKQVSNGVQGILFDLGVSSWHLEKSKRGFSFLKDEILDMRYQGIEGKLTAQKIINNWPEKELVKIFREYGQERFTRRITKEIIKDRKIKEIKTTFQLVKIIEKAVPRWYQHKKIHFATKIFQALRIAVNDELENLKKALPQALEILEKNGRLVIISFHSLEDRISKNFLRESSKKDILKILTKKPIGPTVAEIKVNPRSRSAKLRAAIKL